MDYVPAWVKTDPQRFKRVISPTGKQIWNLSSHCQANLEADKKAFTAMCKYLRAKDSAEQTVIGIQIQNESGIMGSDRDYSPEAQAIYYSPVPAKLLTAMKKAGKGRVFDIWQKTGGKEKGTWPELFGWEAGELMTALSIASYIDKIAESGKAAYNIPMYVNVWLMGQHWWQLPGESYPSGGAVVKVLDIYKWFTPHVDTIAPDAHVAESKAFENVCADYTRDDNPFFMPETGGVGNSHAWNMFRSIGDYNSIGDFFFGVERVIAPDGAIAPGFENVVDSVRCVAAVIPLLLKYQGTGKVHTVLQEDLTSSHLLDLDGFMGLVEFGERRAGYSGKDWRHMPPEAQKMQFNSNRGRGFVIQADKNEFYLVGANYRLYLRPKPSMENMQGRLVIADAVPKLPGWYIVSIDEGHFDQKGEFTVDRWRNGDEIDPAVWMEPDCGVVRVITCD
jgi:hypothetical protein